jgi:hypothetical protein
LFELDSKILPAVILGVLRRTYRSISRDYLAELINLKEGPELESFLNSHPDWRYTSDTGTHTQNKTKQKFVVEFQFEKNSYLLIFFGGSEQSLFLSTVKSNQNLPLRLSNLNVSNLKILFVHISPKTAFDISF